MQGQGGEAALTFGLPILAFTVGGLSAVEVAGVTLIILLSLTQALSLWQHWRTGGALVSALCAVAVAIGAVIGALAAVAIVLGITDIRYLWIVGVLALYAALGTVVLRIAGSAIATSPHRKRGRKSEESGWVPSPKYRRFVPASVHGETHEPVSDLERVDN